MGRPFLLCAVHPDKRRSQGSSIIYFFKYVVRDESKFTFYATSGSIAFILGATATKWLLKLADRRTLMITLSVANALLMATFYLVTLTRITC